MKNLFSLAIVIVSLLLYIFSPSYYSWTYCVLCAIVYAVNALIGLAPGFKREPVSFSLFFSLAVFLNSFLFPLFIYPIDSSYSLFFFFFNQDVITKATSLVTLAQSVYWYGVTMAGNTSYRKFLNDRLDVNDSLINIFIILVVILFMLFLYLGGLDYFTDRYLEGIMSHNSAFQYTNILFSTIVVMLSCMLIFAKNSFTYLKACAVLIIISIVILSTGSRTIPLYIILPLVYIYQKRYNVSMVKLVLFGFALLFVFVAVGHLRHDVLTTSSISSYNIKSSELGIWDNMIDFIVCNRNLYDICSYVQHDGILWGKNFLGPILSVIPFAQGIVSDLSGIPTYQLNSAEFCTYQVFGPHAPFGVGTHVVGDVYLATGIVGVVLLFYLLGYFVTKVRNGALANNHHFMYVVYLYMLSSSVFLCRSSFLGPVKGIVWSSILLYLFNYRIVRK